MNEKANVCEACQNQPVQVVESADDEEQPYHLCASCHQRLTTLSLRPYQWYNLAVIHSPTKFYMHDDFYDDHGEATQPEEDFEILDNEMAPTLADVVDDLEALLDYSQTFWFLETDVIMALCNHAPEQVLTSIKNRFETGVNYEIKARMIEIAGEVLGDRASSWIRMLWGRYNGEFLIELSEASAHCLPSEEGLDLVFDKLKDVEDKHLPIRAFSCLHAFRSDRVLDWMETTVTNFHESWGRLGAVSRPTWKRMKSWLEKGRPFSLVAFSTMENCLGSDMPIARYEPIISNTNLGEVDEILKSYYNIDKVPRIRKQLSSILEYKEEIFK